MFYRGLINRNLFKTDINSLTKSLTKLNLNTQLSAPKLIASKIEFKKFHTNVKLLEEKPEQPVKPDQSASSLFSQTFKEIETKVELDKYGIPIEREYRYSTTNFKIGLRKLMLLANQISGLSINQAILQMQFSQKRASKKIMNALVFSRKNAQLQKNFDPERMYIAQAWVGKGNYITNLIDIKGRGRFGLKEHPFCHMKFIFKEKVENPKPTVEGMNERRKIKGFYLRRNVWHPHRDTRPIYNPKPFYNW
ncbi:ribosomal protein L22 [Neoconidiobolus thromboides FSU 785]|nr:ribosomal protein L22 [Neoconidiobolus thromboides FSU 785]